MTLTTIEESDQLISTSLDQTMSVWTNPDGRFKCYLASGGVQEPVYCLVNHGTDIVTAGTSSNKVTVRNNATSGTNSETATVTSKLRAAEVLRTYLSSLALLPMNRQFLVGMDNGSIVLIN